MYASVNNMLAVMTLSAVALWKHVLHKNICNTLYFFIGINAAIIIQNIWFFLLLVKVDSVPLRNVEMVLEKTFIYSFVFIVEMSYFGLHQCVV